LEQLKVIWTEFL
jgi:hypothetical protein